MITRTEAHDDRRRDAWIQHGEDLLTEARHGSSS